MRCFWFNDPSHKFKTLTRVYIIFFVFLSYFIFLISSFDIVFLYKKSFVIFFAFFSIRLSQSHDLDHESDMLTRVGSDFFMRFPFLLVLILLWFLPLKFCSL